MAKSARSSVRKKNNAKLRANVFGPVYDARTERLSAKLQELAAAPKPNAEQEMETDQPAKNSNQDDSVDGGEQKDADVEMQDRSAKINKSQKNIKRNGGNGAHKITKKKAKRSMVFPSDVARKRRQAQNKNR